MSAIDSVSASQGATLRPAAAVLGAATGAAGPGFGEALSALMAAAGDHPTGPAAAAPPSTASAQADKATLPSELTAQATIVPTASTPLPGSSPTKALASPPSKAAVPKPSTALQGFALPTAAITPDATANAATDQAQLATTTPVAEPGVSKPADEEPKADDALPTTATPPALVAAPTPTTFIALPTVALAQDSPTPPISADAQAAKPLLDRVAEPGSDTQARSKAPSATTVLAQTAEAAAAAPTPPAPPAALAPPAESFAQRVAAAAISAPAARLASSASNKTASSAAPAAAAAFGKPSTAAASLTSAAVATSIAVTAVATGDTQTGEGEGGDDASAGPGFSPAGSTSTSASAAAPSPPPVAHATSAIDTVASFAAALVQRLGQRVSRFQVVLNPEGLGQVDVSMRIAADGALEAHIACDKDGGADALKARAGELATSLQQAGFSIAADALRIDAPPPAAAGSFFASADAGGDTRDQRPSPSAWKGAGIATLDAGADLVPAAYAIAGRARGLDIRI